MFSLQWYFGTMWKFIQFFVKEKFWTLLADIMLTQSQLTVIVTWKLSRVQVFDKVISSCELSKLFLRDFSITENASLSRLGSIWNLTCSKEVSTAIHRH